MKPFDPPSPIDPESDWSLGVDVDLNAALAISRSTALAVAAISPVAATTLLRALTAEINAMEDTGDPLSQAAADAVREVLDEVSARQ